MENEVIVATVDVATAAHTEMEGALSEEIAEIEFQAEAITIESEEDYRLAADFGRMLKQRVAEVKEYWSPMKDAAHKAHAEVCRREKAMLQPLTNAEKILKQTMGAYIAEQERKRREAEESARKAAYEEAERKMAEAIALEEAGDREAADVIANEAAIMDEAVGTITISRQSTKADGVYNRKDWKITSIDGSKVPDSFNGVEIRPVDISAVMKIIRAANGQVRIPGITFEETVQVSFRR